MTSVLATMVGWTRNNFCKLPTKDKIKKTILKNVSTLGALYACTCRARLKFNGACYFVSYLCAESCNRYWEPILYYTCAYILIEYVEFEWNMHYNEQNNSFVTTKTQFTDRPQFDENLIQFVRCIYLIRPEELCIIFCSRCCTCYAILKKIFRSKLLTPN